MSSQVLGQSAMYKKMVSVWLVVCLICAFFSPLAEAGTVGGPDSIEIGSAEGARGDTVNVAVYVTPDFMVWKYDIAIQYDPAVLEPVPAGEVTDELGVSGAETFTPSATTPGVIQVAAQLSTHLLLSRAKVFTLHFKIKSDAVTGGSAVTAQAGQSFLYEGDDPVVPTITAGSVTVKAPTTYTVAFDSQGGSTVTSVTYVVYDTVINAPTSPSKSGYTFTGWYKEAAGTNAWNFTADKVTADTTLYAKWQAAAYTYTVTYAAGTHGAMSGGASETVTDGGFPQAVPTIVADGGYTFAGWSSDGGTTKLSGSEVAATPVTGNIAYTAYYTQTNTQQDVAVTIGSASGRPGQSVQVSVAIANATSGVGSYGMKIPFDFSALEVTGITNESGAFFDSRYDNAGGWLQVAWADSNGGDSPIAAGGKLFTVTFKIKETAADGDKLLTVDNQSDLRAFSVTDALAVEMNKTLGNGKVSVTSSNQAAPLASAVTVSGTAQVGQTLTGSYVYSDADGDAEGESTFKWYRSDDASGANKTAIPGAVTHTYLLQAADLGTYISFEVTPVAATGTAMGTPTESARTSAVARPWTPSSSSGGGSPSATPVASNGVNVLVNGKVENAGTATTSKRNEQTVTTITIDPAKLSDKLAAEGQGAKVTIPVDAHSDVVVGELNGQMVKSMEGQQAVLEITTEHASYTLPAKQINIDSISGQIGSSVALQDIKIQIEIAAPTTDTVKVVENAAEKGTFTLVAPPIEFKVKATYGDKTVEVSQFNAYVERTIAIPEGVDPSKITTAVVIDADGSVRHVPTKIGIVNGKYYAIINSLTNSTYSVVWHPLAFRDVESHWAKAAVNDMGSRMVIDGTGEGMFSPDRNITRAEFATIVVRGLGLKLENASSPFSDVKLSDWYAGAINTAYAHQLISGFEDGTFRPNDSITREQAMAMIGKAMTITGLKAKLPVPAANATLLAYTDAQDVSAWSIGGVADSVQAGIITGRSGTTLAPQAFITRAEVAAILQRLLQKSGLI
ncbi:S-layer homology domain-containing protein [Paenibacillus thalictri]|uniref:SLH domain-containing protein n=1 Tax=Paenibacillus thalictri TaxID=2527873 RepID=A0A4Q9DG09_9BACL|nr:S-layer homology domain-containing protein [Paenibacillus thalictri]TBL71095.1 hypothetical protein EYB31_31635 [Paenibacillus thalictri]